jgi:hypothetical protein
MKRAAIILMCATLFGCSDESDSVVGNWQSKGVVYGQRNAMSVDDAGSGKATLYIMFVDQGQNVAGRFEFDATWRERAEDFEFGMECTRTPFGTCEPADDFDMECILATEGADLNCTGSNNWSEYEFAWARN